MAGIDNTRHNLLPQERKEIIQLYSEGQSPQKISIKYNVTVANIRRTLIRFGVPTRKCWETRIPHHLNHDAFAYITPESAYWIGFLMADGWVTTRKTVGVSLAKIDEKQIIKFKNFMQSGHKINIVKARKSSHQEQRQLCFRSQKIVDDLAKYGIVPNKSLIAKVIGLENNRDFWRGLVDGDGSIGTIKRTYGDYPLISLAGSIQITEQFKNYVKSIIPGFKATTHISRNIREIKISGKKAKIIINELYKDAPVYLDRKYTKAMRILQNHITSNCP